MADPLGPGPTEELTPERRDALRILAAYLVQHNSPAAADLLGRLSRAAEAFPYRAAAYNAAAEELRAQLGYDRLFGSEEASR